MKAPDVFQRSGTWVLGVLYFDRRDPRIIVPKRYRSMGWTLNFARLLAIPALILMIFVILAPFQILNHFDVRSYIVCGLVIAAEIIGLTVLCSWRADPARYLKNQEKNHDE